MNFEEHCLDSKEKFGVEMPEVHRYLDEFSSYFIRSSKYKHRQFRHHEEGLKLIKDRFSKINVHVGNLAYLVAEQHIRSDNGGYMPSFREYYDLEEYKFDESDLAEEYNGRLNHLEKEIIIVKNLDVIKL